MVSRLLLALVAGAAAAPSVQPQASGWLGPERFDPLSKPLPRIRREARGAAAGLDGSLLAVVTARGAAALGGHRGSDPQPPPHLPAPRPGPEGHSHRDHRLPSQEQTDPALQPVVGTAAVAVASTGLNSSATNQTGASADLEQTPFYGSLESLIRILTVLVALECALAAAFEYSHRTLVNVDVDRPLPEVPETKRPPLHTIFDGMWQLSRPYFSSPGGVKGRICCVFIIALGLLGLFFAYVHNAWQKEWWDLFNKADSRRFPQLMGAYALLATAWMLTSVYLQYLRSWLYIDWREFMTRRLMRRWLSGHAHFLLQLGAGRVDNPDQRIQEDVHLFVDSTTDIVPDFLSQLGSLVVFVPVVIANEPAKAFGVFQLPGWLLYLALIYALVGTLSTHIIGAPMINFSFARQRYEADFRHLALHVRDNAESVALYGSERTEERNLGEQFDRIKLVQWRQMVVTKRLAFFTSAFGFVQFLVPFFILAPSYFRKDISLGGLFQLTSAISSVAGALDWFLRVYGQLTDWRATADRLLSFEEAIDGVQTQALHAASAIKLSSGKLLADVGEDDQSDEQRGARGGAGVPADASGLTPPEEERGGANTRLRADIREVRLPSGEPIWRNIHVELEPGQRALISGPEGIGKSVLFKALAGVWPFVEGSDVQLPVEDASQVLFVPQRPALPKYCSLAEALAYPESRSAYRDETLLQALRDVKLEELLVYDGPVDGPGGEQASRGKAFEAESPAAKAAGSAGGTSPERSSEGGLDRVMNWSLRLSPGQQQRLAFAHVLLRKPGVLFLDEATSNVGKEAAVELYRTIMQQLPGDAAIVSISHDVDTLAPLHDVHLAVHGEGAAKELRVVKASASPAGHGG